MYSTLPETNAPENGCLEDYFPRPMFRCYVAMLVLERVTYGNIFSLLFHFPILAKLYSNEFHQPGFF